MGLLRDTYVVNRIDISKIGYEMKRKNDIQEAQNIVLNNTRDRVDISLIEYETLKEDLKTTKEELEIYKKFHNDLAIKIKQCPEILLNSRVVKSEIERVPMTMSNNLYVVWEIEDREL